MPAVVKKKLVLLRRKCVFYQACYGFGQSNDYTHGTLKRLFPHGASTRFEGRHEDPHEFMLTVLEIIDEDKELMPSLSYSTMVKAIDDASQTTGGASWCAAIQYVEMNHSTIEACLGPQIEDIDEDVWPTVKFPDGKQHRCQKHDVFSSPSPEDLQHIHISLRIWDWKNAYAPGVLAKEVRSLVIDEPFEKISIKIKNNTTGDLVDLPS